MAGSTKVSGPAAMSAPAPATATISLNVNGQAYSLPIDTRTTLLDLLREQMGLTGTKKGCDHGLCGACTVSIDGERMLSCLSLAVSVDGSEVLTVEGLENGAALSELQQSFLDHDAFQCGYCTPGQLSSARALIVEHSRGDLSMVSYEGTRQQVLSGNTPLTENEVRERMAGNICRCGAYPNIVAAVRAAAHRGRE